jgi:predicted anti-sigma-YlaC factor YlaD
MRHLSEIEIQKYLDRELTREEEIFINKHISGCHVCRKKLSEYREIYQILNQPPEIDLPADFTEKVLAQIPEQQGHKWYKKYLDQILLVFALITSMIVFFYFAGVQILLHFWENVSPTFQDSFTYLVKYFENNPNHLMITKYFMVALFILASIKLFDSFLFLRKRDISTP